MARPPESDSSARRDDGRPRTPAQAPCGLDVAPVHFCLDERAAKLRPDPREDQGDRRGRRSADDVPRPRHAPRDGQDPREDHREDPREVHPREREEGQAAQAQRPRRFPPQVPPRRLPLHRRRARLQRPLPDGASPQGEHRCQARRALRARRACPRHEREDSGRHTSRLRRRRGRHRRGAPPPGRRSRRHGAHRRRRDSSTSPVSEAPPRLSRRSSSPAPTPTRERTVAPSSR